MTTRGTFTTLCSRCGVEPLPAPVFDAEGRVGSRNTYCKGCRAEYTRTRRSRPGYVEPKSSPESRRNSRLKARYQMSLEKYDAMLSAQGGMCALCLYTPADGHSLQVDHDHSCCPGQTSCGRCVRQLLCGPCNWRVGDVENGRYEAALEYVKRWTK